MQPWQTMWNDNRRYNTSPRQFQLVPASRRFLSKQSAKQENREWETNQNSQHVSLPLVRHSGPWRTPRSHGPKTAWLLQLPTAFELWNPWHHNACHMDVPCVIHHECQHECQHECTRMNEPKEQAEPLWSYHLAHACPVQFSHACKSRTNREHRWISKKQTLCSSSSRAWVQQISGLPSLLGHASLPLDLYLVNQKGASFGPSLVACRCNNQ